MNSFKTISVNVRGIRNADKRKIVFSWIKNQKASIVFLQETHITHEIQHLIENELKGTWVFANGSNRSCGVCVYISNALDVQMVDFKASTDGRKILINLLINGDEFSLLNIYAPTNKTNREQFFKRLTTFIRRNCKNMSKLIIGGDMNCVMNPSVDTKGAKSVYKPSNALKSIIKCFKLCDIWRKLHPNVHQFTWRQLSLGVSSRIDFWLVSKDMIQFIENTCIKPTVKSDHNAIMLSVKMNNVKHGPGYWKMNVNILKDELYVKAIKQCIAKCKNEYSNENPQVKWEVCKVKIKELTQAFSKKKAKQNRGEVKEIEKKLCDLEEKINNGENSPNICKDYTETKSKLERYYQQKCKGASIRARVRWFEEGEKNTKYFLNLEKHQGVKKQLTKVRTEQNKTVTTEEEVLNETVKFYQNLYTSQEIKDDDICNYLNNVRIRKLNKKDRVSCEGLITLSECKKAVFKMKKNKTPGSDGLPIEWYQMYWDNISYLPLNPLNYSFAYGQVYCSQRKEY